MLHILDLHFQVPNSIAAFVVETSEGPVLVECGPHSVFPHLKAGVQGLGYRMEDIRHLFLSHIHFDHAGAAWALAELGAQVYVHPVGYPHLLDPARLYNSAKRIYGDQMERLWGLMKPIPEAQLVAVADGQTITVGDHHFRAWHTPGHATHHIAWQMGETIFTGDVAGCSINGGPVVPPCPPPDINLEDWTHSIDKLLALQPRRLYLTHFGEVGQVQPHFEALKHIMWDWANWIRPHFDAGRRPEEVVPAFQAYTNQQLLDAGLDQEAIAKYEAANPAWMSVAGLMRYWKKRKEQIGS
ncbi:MAG: MBL fold metallo-hydrolase [Bacteroidetes bacterium]|nr:MAG: MBL fold metallo-hydrolase [Bacteroidota bacterium]